MSTKPTVAAPITTAPAIRPIKKPFREGVTVIKTDVICFAFEFLNLLLILSTFVFFHQSGEPELASNKLDG
jgi:hypothetical protein